jgi:AraC-like DNA-binding protein/mannose-6-phosphate isomerase-like protein (cupin superfamily)
MARSKKSSASLIRSERPKIVTIRPLASRSFVADASLRVPKSSCEEHFRLVEPQINAEGIHVWNFDTTCPLDVLVELESGQQKVRMNRHSYFEVLYLSSGSAMCHVQDRLLPMHAGDLAVIGSTLYHRIERRSSSPLTIVALFFDPEIIRCDGDNDSIEYLKPFLLQDATFPHVIPSETGIPARALGMMARIRAERYSDNRSRLSMKTCLKMILAELVQYYESYSSTVEVFYRQERLVDRIRPLLHFLEENCGASIKIRQAARVCGMSESYFMNVFKDVTGVSFLKYLNQYRVEKAQTLLTHSDASMKNICQEVGFCDQSYFGAVFRKIAGLTPGEYRRRLTNGAGHRFTPIVQDRQLGQIRGSLLKCSNESRV